MTQFLTDLAITAGFLAGAIGVGVLINWVIFRG